MKILSTPYFDNNQLKEVATPTTDTDAANKQYVDSRELDDVADVTVDNPSSGQVLKYNGTDWVNDGVRSSDIVPLLSKTYTNVLRNNSTYTSPYPNSYLYFGQVKPVDVDKPSMIAYHILAYAPSNSSFMLDAIVKYYFSSDGIYKAYYVWNNLNSTSYYPFGYHTLFRSNTKAISQSDGSYLGVYYGSSTSYGQSPHTVARTFVVDIVGAENCTYNLLDNVVWFNDTANLPENLAPTSASTAYNTTNFTAVNTATTVGLQETGDANQNTIGYQLRTNSITLTAADYFGRYRLLFTSADNTQWVPATTSTSTNATALRDVNQRKINPFGRIEYYSTTTVVQADTNVTSTNIWDQYVLTLGYSFNRTGAALVLPFPAPVYVKCAPQADGSAIIDSTTPYVHSLPSTDDGKIYILLGHTYSATNIELVPHHPVYYHDGTGIRIWEGTRPFSGSYNNLTNKPTLGTAAALDVAASGDASTTQVVKGDDTRLSDSRNAADVYSWAKAATKPSYTASEVGAIATTAKGTNGGVAELDSNGKVPSSQLPSYVDDVLEYASLSNFPATGETGKIYIAQDTNKTYRWSGSAYTEISESLALGETSSTAYAGNKGKANADAIAAIKDGTTIDSFSDVETALSGKQATIDSSHKLSADLVSDGTTNKVYTATEKTKLSGIEAGAQVNVKPDWNAASGAASEILNKPTIPDAVSGTNDGTNWTSLTIGDTTKAIPAGGGGGLTNYDFTHTANTTVSTSTTVTFAANTRGSQMVSTAADLDVAFSVNNSSDNYLWIKNTGSSEIDITVSGVTYNSSSVSNVYIPDDGISIPAGKVCEIGVVCNGDGAFITSRSDLSL